MKIKIPRFLIPLILFIIILTSAIASAWIVYYYSVKFTTNIQLQIPYNENNFVLGSTSHSSTISNPTDNQIANQLIEERLGECQKSTFVSKTHPIPQISGTLLFEKGQMYTTDDLTSKTSCTHEGGLFGVTKYFYITQQWQPVNENGPSNTLLAAADKSDESPYEFTNKDIYNSGTFFVPKGIIMSGCLLFEDDDKIIRPNVKAAFNRIWFDRDVYAKSGFSYTTKEVPSEFTTIWTDPQGYIVKKEITTISDPTTTSKNIASYFPTTTTSCEDYIKKAHQFKPVSTETAITWFHQNNYLTFYRDLSAIQSQNSNSRPSHFNSMEDYYKNQGIIAYYKIHPRPTFPVEIIYHEDSQFIKRMNLIQNGIYIYNPNGSIKQINNHSDQKIKEFFYNDKGSIDSIDDFNPQTGNRTKSIHYNPDNTISSITHYDPHFHKRSQTTRYYHSFLYHWLKLSPIQEETFYTGDQIREKLDKSDRTLYDIEGKTHPYVYKKGPLWDNWYIDGKFCRRKYETNLHTTPPPTSLDNVENPQKFISFIHKYIVPSGDHIRSNFYFPNGQVDFITEHNINTGVQTKRIDYKGNGSFQFIKEYDFQSAAFIRYRYPSDLTPEEITAVEQSRQLALQEYQHSQQAYHSSLSENSSFFNQKINTIRQTSPQTYQIHRHFITRHDEIYNTLPHLKGITGIKAPQKDRYNDTDGYFDRQLINTPLFFYTAYLENNHHGANPIRESSITIERLIELAKEKQKILHLFYLLN